MRTCVFALLISRNQISLGRVHADADITLADAGRRKALGKMFKSTFGQTPKAVDFGNGGTDLDGQDFDGHHGLGRGDPLGRPYG